MLIAFHFTSKLKWATLVSVLFFSGCSQYHAKPLIGHHSLVKKVTQLKGYPRIEAPLSIHQVALLALLNNAGLAAKREQLGVFKAQLISARLFPDPMLSSNLDQPLDKSKGFVNAWGLGIGYDLMSLITHSDEIDVASNVHKQAQQTLLWQEWQVVQQARTLYLKSVFESRRLILLSNAFRLYQMRYEESEKAMQQGDTTLDTVSVTLTRLMDYTSQLNQLAQTHNDTQQKLTNVLSLEDSSLLELQKIPRFFPLSLQLINTHLENISKTRPDLLALKFGYLSQEALVRKAVLMQFPAITLGFNHARDTGGLLTQGLSISLNLPLFNGNRGQIAQARATRSQLFAEFKARLNKVQGKVQSLNKLEYLLKKHNDELSNYLPKVNALAEQALLASQEGELNFLIYINFKNSLIQKQLEQLSIEQSRWENKVALQTLLAIPVDAPNDFLPILSNQGTLQ